MTCVTDTCGNPTCGPDKSKSEPITSDNIARRAASAHVTGVKATSVNTRDGSATAHATTGGGGRATAHATTGG